MFSSRDRNARHPGALLVEDDACERPVEKPDHRQAADAQREDHPEIRPGNREDRAEQECEQVDTEAARR